MNSTYYYLVIILLHTEGVYKHSKVYSGKNTKNIYIHINTNSSICIQCVVSWIIGPIVYAE